MSGCDVSDAADTVPPFLHPLNSTNRALSGAEGWGRYSLFKSFVHSVFCDGRIPDLRIPDAMNISMIYLMKVVGAGLLTLHAVETTVSAFKQNGVAAIDGYMLHTVLGPKI